MDFNEKYGTADPKDTAEWFKLDDAEFLIASNDSIAFRNETLRTFKIGEIKSDGLEDKTALELVELESHIKAKTVLIDWKGVKDGDKEIAYSVSKAKDLLVKYDEFRTWVDSKADYVQDKLDSHKSEAKKK